MADVFLSYSREDQDIARHFAEGLLTEGFSVWWDQALVAGEAFDKVTERALDGAQAVVVLWSKHSVESRWVRAEATQAQANGRLVPVMIEPCRRPIMFELTHAAELSGWSGSQSDPRWRSLIKGLRESVGQHATAGTAKSGSPEFARRAPAFSRRQAIWATGAVALLVLAVALFLLFRRDGAGAAGSGTDPSIAVLPFEDMSPAKDQGYFADGVAEQILDALAAVGDLKVTARTSAMAFKDKDQNVQAIGRALGVAHVLEGSVRKAGDRLRINAQLILVDTGFQVWSKTYERPFADIFAVQDDIARSVAESLQVSLGLGIAQGPGMTRDAEAYDDYLAGQYLINEYSAEGQRRAVEVLQRAVSRDPAFAKAWATLARAYGGIPAVTGEDPKEWTAKADTAFEKFEQLLPGSVEVELQQAFRGTQRGRFVDTARHFKNAAAVAGTNLGFGAQGPGAFLILVGRTREALPLLEQDRARDPLNKGLSFYLVHAYGNAGNPAAAFAEAERGSKLSSREMPQALFYTAALTQALGARDRTQYQRWLAPTDLTGSTPPAATTTTQTISPFDRPGEALTQWRTLADDATNNAVTLLVASVYFGFLGDPQAAIDTLDAAFERGLAGESAITLWYPVMRDARRLPAFKVLVKKLGLVDYWREFGWSDYCQPVGSADFECH